jgi:hypothetical protein
MPDITITFDDGKQHVYQNAPDTLQPSDVYSRAQKDFPSSKVKSISKGAVNAPAAPKSGEPDYMVLPESAGIAYFDPEKQKEYVRGQAEGAKGFLSGVGQVGTGALELIPGVGDLIPSLGSKAAQWTKYLKGVGDPTMQKVGEYATIAAPIPFGKAKALEEGLSFGSRLLKGAKTGGLTGFLGGAIAPTGEEGTERYLEKGKQALAGGALGTVLGAAGGGLFGARAPKVSSEEIYSRMRTTGESLADAAKKMAEERAGKGTEEAKKLYEDIVKQNRNLFEAESEAGTSRIMKAGKEARIEPPDATSAVEKQRASMLEKFGPEKELTQIGQPIQEAASGAKKAIETERSQADSVLRSARDEIVRENERVGKTIADTPTAQQMLDDIKKLRDPALKPEFERRNPGLSKLQDRVYDTLVNKRVELSPEEAKKAIAAGQNVEIKGTRFFRTFRSSFEGVDDLRRFMGEAFRGKAPEGYEGISANAQKDLYGKLDAIEREYVGSAQPKLQQNWREASQKLEEFENKYGKSLTELAGPEGAFSKEGAAIPGAIFNNQDSVNAAISLTKNPDLIRSAARQYLRNQFKNMSASEVTNFLNNPKNRDWLNHPELKTVFMDAQKHSSDLARVEKEATAAGEALAERAKMSAADVKRIEKETSDTLARIQEETSKALKSKDVKVAEIGKQLQQSSDTLSEFRTSLSGDPSNLAKQWPKIRTSLENTKLFQTSDLDALQKDLFEAGKIADKEARVSAYTDTIAKLMAKKTAKWLGLGALGAGAAGGSFELFKGD